MVKTTQVSGGSSVVVSHVISTIERSAENVVLLYDGKLRWQGPIDSFRATDNPYVVQFRSASLDGPMQPGDQVRLKLMQINLDNLQHRKKRVLYLSYDGMLEDLGNSQVLQYLLGLSDLVSFSLVSFEKKRIF